MKKYLHYLWASMFAVAALPAAAQTADDPQELVVGENTITMSETYFKFTSPETGLVYVEGMALSTYGGGITATYEDGTSVNVSFASDAYANPKWLAFNAEASVEYTFSYQTSWNQEVPFTVDCTMTPITEGSLFGETCSDPIVIPQGGQRLLPFPNTGVNLTAYAKYTVEKNGRLLVKTTSNIVLKTGFGCDAIDEAWTNYDYEYSSGMYTYDESYMVEAGDVIYLEATGTTGCLITLEVEDVTPGMSCKDAWTITEDGQYEIPAEAGTYWFMVTAPSTWSYCSLVVSSDSKASASLAVGCDYRGMEYETLNFRSDPIQQRNSRILKVVKTEATSAPEYFDVTFEPLKPIEDDEVGEALTPGVEVTTPDADKYYYYSITAPEDTPMLMVINSNVSPDNPNYSEYVDAIKVTVRGEYGKVAGGTNLIKMQTVPGTTYLFTVNVKENTPITFSVDFLTLEPGSLSTYPIVAELGNNEIPAFSPVYYSFTDAEGMKLQLSTDVEGATITAQYVERSWGSPSYYNVTLNENEKGYWLKAAPGVEYIFTLENPKGTTGNLELTQLEFEAGEAWQTAEEVEAGTYDLPNAPMEYWFKLVAPQTGFFTVNSNMSAANYSNQMWVYKNDVTGKAIEAARDYNSYPDYIYTEIKTSVNEGQVLYVKLLSYDEQDDITVTFAFEEAKEGETAATAIPINYVEGGITYDFPGTLGYDANYNYIYEWYSIDLPAGILSVTCPNTFSVNLYAADDTDMPLVSGSWNSNNDYGILRYNVEKAGKYYLSVFNTSNYEGREVVTANIVVRAPEAGETIETAVVVSESGQEVEVPKTDGDDFYVKINVQPGELTFLAQPGEYMNANLYNENDLTNEVAEIFARYDEQLDAMISGLENFKVAEAGAYILRVYSCQDGATLTFSGSALGGEVVVDPVFPEELDITASAPGIEIDQAYDDEIEALTINVGGVSDTEDFTLSFNLPEGWDGVILANISMGGFSMDEWPTIGEFEEEMEDVELLKGTEFTFTAPTRMKIFSGYLYTGDKVDVEHGFMLGLMVDYEKTDVVVNVEVLDGAAFNYTLPVNTASSFGLNLPADWEVKSALLNGEDIEVADKYTVEAGDEDLDYVFEVEYTGEFVTVDSTTGMVALDTTVTIGIVDGKIRIENTTVGDAITVYSIGGMVVGQYKAQDTAVEISVAPGTYIVTVNKNAAKVLVP